MELVTACICDRALMTRALHLPQLLFHKNKAAQQRVWQQHGRVPSGGRGRAGTWGTRTPTRPPAPTAQLHLMSLPAAPGWQPGVGGI